MLAASQQRLSAGRSGFLGTASSRPTAFRPAAVSRSTCTITARYRGYNTNLTKVPEFKLHETDTGSTPVQIARITARIQQLSGHLEQHKKDFATRRGMIMLLGQRRSLLLYLHRQNRDSYYQIIKDLGIRNVVQADTRGEQKEVF